VQQIRSSMQLVGLTAAIINQCLSRRLNTHDQEASTWTGLPYELVSAGGMPTFG